MSVLTGIRRDVRRRFVRYWRPGPVVVCECNAWDGFLIQAMRPDAVRIPLTPGEPAARVLHAIPAAARVVAMHVDLSRTDGFLTEADAMFARLEGAGVVTLNARASDTRKRTLHEMCEARGLPSARAARSGPPHERVIVKTTLNAAGVPERRLAARHRHLEAHLSAEVNAGITEPTEYRVCRRMDVPAAVWGDQTLVVERFLANPQGVYYRVYCVGPATVVVEAWSDLEVKKLSRPVRRRVQHFFWTVAGEHVPLDAVPREAARAVAVTRRAAAALGVDFHSSDCVLDSNGSMIPVDINKTPYWRPGPPEILDHLRLGLEALTGAS